MKWTYLGFYMMSLHNTTHNIAVEEKKIYICSKMIYNFFLKKWKLWLHKYSVYICFETSKLVLVQPVIRSHLFLEDPRVWTKSIMKSIWTKNIMKSKRWNQTKPGQYSGKVSIRDWLLNKKYSKLVEQQTCRIILNLLLEIGKNMFKGGHPPNVTSKRWD